MSWSRVHAFRWFSDAIGANIAGLSRTARTKRSLRLRSVLLHLSGAFSAVYLAFVRPNADLASVTSPATSTAGDATSLVCARIYQIGQSDEPC